jgi:hypothetical protein
MLPVFHTWQELSLGPPITLELISDEHPGYKLAPFEELAEEPLGSRFIPASLHQNIEHMALLIHGPPEIMPLPMNREKHFIQVPFIPRLRPSETELIGLGLPKLAAPFPDRFVGHHHPAGEQEFLNIAIAETKPVVQPDAVTDNFGRETVVLIAVGGDWCVHTTSMSHTAAAEQVDNAHRRH